LIFEGFAQSQFQMVHKTKNYYPHFMLAVMGYAMVGFTLIQLYHNYEMGTTNMMWSGLSVISVKLLGMFLFREKINWIIISVLTMFSIGFILLFCTQYQKHH
jgi:multidrug transporter EmrE-like cation transporter